MGGYDLYGNYYDNSDDAWNAETAQMNEIDNNAIKNRLSSLERKLPIKAPRELSGMCKHGLHHCCQGRFIIRQGKVRECTCSCHNKSSA